ncbi:MAG TPA: methyltransferase, TIGR04325 family, partial [Chitinophagaceae bacterium]|nr:methyltransferase, TIGR04325 family [Chitinophagaceae bacterium]
MSVVDKIKENIIRLISPAPKYYNSYEEAQFVSGSGYEDSELVDVIVLKTQLNRHLLNNELSFNNSTLSTLTAILYICQKFESVNVIDLGGSTGLQYHMIRPSVNEKVRINWCVVESTALADKCKPLFSSKELHFSDNLERSIKELGIVHLILCSGVIQYLPKPCNVLKTIANSNSHYLLFSRMCFSKQKHEIITLQRTLLSENGFGTLPLNVKDKELHY